MKTHTYIQRL